MPARSMIHLNGNILCSIDCETTGFDPMLHDIWQVCVLPLNADVRPLKGVLPFYTEMKCPKWHNADPEAISRQKLADIQLKGIDPDVAADMLQRWFEEKLNLPLGKKICPLAQNWPFDRGFLQHWLGFKNFDAIFHPWYRDLLPVSLYANDRADINVEQIPYPKSNLAYLCSTLGVENNSPHDALSDCIATAEVYRKMLTQLF